MAGSILSILLMFRAIFNVGSLLPDIIVTYRFYTAKQLIYFL
jgi:hypothetical protein